jgi:hypothetical protein
MKIFGKSLGEYVRFSKVFTILIAVIGITRLALSLGGAPDAVTAWFSMTAVLWIGVVYYAIRVHTSGFGAYRHLLPVVALLNITSQTISIAAIIIAVFTGVDNVFSAPEFSFGADGKTWFHAGAHLVLGTTAGTIIPWLIGSLVLFISTKLTGNSRTGAPAHTAKVGH